MVVRVSSKWFWCGLLASALGAAWGCGGAQPVAVPDGATEGQPGRPGGSSDTSGSIGTEWFESWKTAALGPKAESGLEGFEADSGVWGASAFAGWGVGWLNERLVAGNGSWTGGEVSILDGDRLLLRSHAAYLGSMSYSEAKGTVGKRLVLPSEGDPRGFPVGRDTTFSGIIDCEVQVRVGPEHDNSKRTMEDWQTTISGVGGASSWLVIEFSVRDCCTLRYTTENSVGSWYSADDLAEAGLPFMPFFPIPIPREFERNIYDDLVAMYGQDFADDCLWTPCRLEDITLETYSDYSKDPRSTSDPPDDPGRFVDCTCYVHQLKLTP